MTVNHEVVAAVPISGDADKPLLRALIAGRLIYFFGDSDDPADFVATDPNTGDVTPIIAKGGTLFWYDASDTTTAADGTTSYVSADSKRYKISGAAAWVDSVLDKDTSAQPASPSIGDAYLVPAAATGTDWAGHDDDVAIYTARGWEFASPATGRLLYVEDEESYYHYEAAGDWVLGIGLGALGDNDVSPANFLGGRSHFIVENQTTNSPPSPAAGIAYIVGSSPTGAWAGKAGYIAIRDKLATGWVYVAPTEGLTAYDKTNNLAYIYNGSAWAAQAQGYTGVTDVANSGAASLSTSGSNSTGYAYSDTVAPTSTQNRRVEDTQTLAVQADFAGQVVEVDYVSRSITSALTGGTATSISIGLFVDSETNARQWRVYSTTSGYFQPIIPFRITLADTASHTLKIILFPNAGSNITGGTLTVNDRWLRARRRAT